MDRFTIAPYGWLLLAGAAWPSGKLGWLVVWFIVALCIFLALRDIWKAWKKTEAWTPPAELPARPVNPYHDPNAGPLPPLYIDNSREIDTSTPYTLPEPMPGYEYCCNCYAQKPIRSRCVACGCCIECGAQLGQDHELHCSSMGIVREPSAPNPMARPPADSRNSSHKLGENGSPVSLNAAPSGIRCSDCKTEEGGQHKPSCHRQGLVTAFSDYRGASMVHPEDLVKKEMRAEGITARGAAAKGEFLNGPMTADRLREISQVLVQYSERPVVSLAKAADYRRMAHALKIFAGEMELAAGIRDAAARGESGGRG